MIHQIALQGHRAEGRSLLCDEQDYILLSKYTWKLDKHGYPRALLQDGYTRVYAHRLLMNPGNLHVDHINRNPLDVRRTNLRTCTPQENNRNRVFKTKSGYQSVTLNGNKYQVQLTINGTRTKYGTYTTRHAAAIVANIVRREIHGEFSVGDNIGTLHQLYYPELHH